MSRSSSPSPPSLLLAALMFVLGGEARAASTHPLDPLTDRELGVAVAAVRADERFASLAVHFAGLALEEPPKALVLAAQRGGPTPPRRALATMFEPRANRVTEVSVELTASPERTAKKGALSGKMVGVRVVPDVQPPILLEEYDAAAKLIQADPRWRAAIARRGIASPDEIFMDTWAPGLLSASERASGHRFMRGISFWKGKTVNAYGHPIEGVIGTVDLTSGTVTDVIDTDPVPVSRVNEDFDRLPPSRSLRPLQVAMPKGVSFSVDGTRIRWQGFSFRQGMHPQKGLVLYDVAFEEEAGKPRSVLYKGTLSEMVVPYSDPDPVWAFRNAFDVGEYGLGRAAHSLERGVDAPANAVFFDSVFTGDAGGLVRIPRAVALYERDGGVLWKHVEQGARKGSGMRARELVLTFTTTIGNYDYGVEWVFHQDGVIDAQVYLSGILLAKGSVLEKNPCEKNCKRLVASQVLAPSHQHFFNFRVDLDVDGAEDNALVESNVHALPQGPANPSGNAFDADLTTLATEQAARRDLDPRAARCWKVVSRSAKNRWGHPTGYTLKPGETAHPYLVASSPIRQRAAFIDHALWATRYRDGEQGAAGEYANQSRAGEGLPRFQSDDEPLDGSDVVLWYSFGITHVPRPEEWPVMNVHRVGFSLLPTNFFARNPALTPR